MTPEALQRANKIQDQLKHLKARYWHWHQVSKNKSLQAKTIGLFEQAIAELEAEFNALEIMTEVNKKFSTFFDRQYLDKFNDAVGNLNQETQIKFEEEEIMKFIIELLESGDLKAHVNFSAREKVELCYLPYRKVNQLQETNEKLRNSIKELLGLLRFGKDYISIVNNAEKLI